MTHHAVGRGTRLVGDADRLEIAEIVEAALGAIDEHLVVGVAFAEIEFAADDVVAGAGVAAHVDALDIDARSFLDHVAEVDGLGRGIAGADRTNLGERVAVAGRIGGHVLQGLLNRVRVVDRAGRGRDVAANHFLVDVRNARFDVDGADAVLLALFDGDRDDVAAGVARRTAHRWKRCGNRHSRSSGNSGG